MSVLSPELFDIDFAFAPPPSLFDFSPQAPTTTIAAAGVTIAALMSSLPSAALSPVRRVVAYSAAAPTLAAFVCAAG